MHGTYNFKIESTICWYVIIFYLLLSCIKGWWRIDLIRNMRPKPTKENISCVLPGLFLFLYWVYNTTGCVLWSWIRLSYDLQYDCCHFNVTVSTVWISTIRTITMKILSPCSNTTLAWLPIMILFQSLL